MSNIEYCEICKILLNDWFDQIIVETSMMCNIYAWYLIFTVFIYLYIDINFKQIHLNIKILCY